MPAGPGKPLSGLRRTAVELALAAVALVALPAVSALARPAAQNGPIIAFEGHRAGGADIFLMRLDGTSIVNATHDARFDGQPAWAPPYRFVEESPGVPATDPSNCQIPQTQDLAFTRADAAGRLDIYRLTVTSPNDFPASSIGAPVRLTTDPAADTAPAWSPGPRSQASSGDDVPARPLLAFVREAGDRDIYAMNPDDPGTETLLTSDSAAHDDHPDWSPLVTRDDPANPNSVQRLSIAFDSDRSGNTQIWTMDVTYQPGRVPAFTAGPAQQVTTGPSPHTNPSWTVFEDGSRGLVYTAVEEGVQYIDLLVASGFSSFLALTGEPGGDDAPEWSPFGDEVLFSRTQGGETNIQAINPYGFGLPESPNLRREPPLAPGEVRALTSQAGADLNPTRQPTDRPCAGVEPNAPIPRTPSRPARAAGGGGGGGAGGGGGGPGGGPTGNRQDQRGVTRRALSARITRVTVTTRGRRRTIVIRLRVNVRVSVRARLYRGTRQVTSRLWRLRRSGTHVLRLRIPSRARAGRHRLRLTVRPTSGAPKRLARTVRLRR